MNAYDRGSIRDVTTNEAAVYFGYPVHFPLPKRTRSCNTDGADTAIALTSFKVRKQAS